MDTTPRTELAACQLPCPICQSGTLEKRLNETYDEIWVCTDCPAVLFTYWHPENITRLYSAMEGDDPMPHRIRHLNHWRPPHNPWTYTGDGRYPTERLTAADRRYLKHRVRRLLRRIDGEEWPQPLDDDH